MKKILVASILAVSFLSATTTMASLKYECWTYVNGDPDKMITRTAGSKSEAQSMARGWFRDNGYKFDSVKCK